MPMERLSCKCASSRYVLSTKYISIRQYILYVVDMTPPTYDRSPARQNTGQGKAQLLLAGEGDGRQSYNFVAAEKRQGGWNQF